MEVNVIREEDGDNMITEMEEAWRLVGLMEMCL